MEKLFWCKAPDNVIVSNIYNNEANLYYNIFCSLSINPAFSLFT